MIRQAKSFVLHLLASLQPFLVLLRTAQGSPVFKRLIAFFGPFPIWYSPTLSDVGKLEIV